MQPDFATYVQQAHWWQLARDAISLSSDFLSIVGLAFVWLGVRKLEESYARQATVPALVNKLQACHSGVSSSLEDRDTYSAITHLARAVAHVRSLIVFVPEEARSQFRSFVASVELLVAKPPPAGEEAALRTAAHQLATLAETAGNYSDLWSWERRDG